MSSVAPIREGMRHAVEAALGKPNHEAVALLEELLAAAKRGDLQSIAGVTGSREGFPGHFASINCQPQAALSLLGAFHLCALQIARMIERSIHDDPRPAPPAA